MAKTKLVADLQLDEYQDRFKEHFVMKRENGILEIRMHTQGGEAKWGKELHRALPQIFQIAGADRKNEVIILTATGDYWLREFDHESWGEIETNEMVFAQANYDFEYLDAHKLCENLLWNIDVPLISAINGPGFHTEFALLFDITICADTTNLFEAHLGAGLVPGDGQFLVFQELLGLKRANWFMFTREVINAQQALDWGLVNEVLPKDSLMDRAWELAEDLMKIERVTRRLTTAVTRRHWKKIFTDYFSHQMTSEMYAMMVDDLKTHQHSTQTVSEMADFLIKRE